MPSSDERRLVHKLASKDFEVGGGAAGSSSLCGFAAESGPQEVDVEAWDGVSLWIGRLPNTGIVRSGSDGGSGGGRAGKGSSGAGLSASPSARAVSDIFAAMYTLSDELAGLLAAHGEGLDQSEGLSTVCLEPGNRSWALVTFKRPEDAASLYEQGLVLTAPVDALYAEKTVTCDVRRTIDAVAAREMLEQAATQERQQHELCVAAVSRIGNWLKRSGKQLADLFTKIDTDGSGDFDVTEFRAGMLSIGLTFNDETIHALMSYMDTDGGGSIDTQEFVQKMDKFVDEQLCSATAVLAELCEYLDRSGETIAEICKRNDKDGSGDLSVREFHEVLTRVGITLKLQQARDVMTELDMDHAGELELTTAELSARLASYRRRRRAFAAKVLSGVFAYIKKTNASATRIFARVDTNGTGDLDLLEFQEALLRMGQQLTRDEVREVMSELDLDNSGSIGVSEFLDKLKQAENMRAADMRKVKTLFDQADSDGSGFLDVQEVGIVAKQMGLGEQIQNPAFVTSMLAEMEAGRFVIADGTKVTASSNKVLQTHRSVVESAGSSGGSGGSGEPHDGQVDYEEFIEWYFEIGKSYLDRPTFKVQPNLTAPSEKELAELFAHIDADGSGSVDLVEVQDALHMIWPYMDPVGFQRAFEAADQDGSGCVDKSEFKQMFDFIVWLNDKRHTVQELDDAFGTHVGEDEFYFGCQGLQMIGVKGDGAAKFLFEEECRIKGGVDELSFDEFISWAVRFVCVTQRYGAPPETESQRKARVCAEMSKELEHAAGEYGDVHMQDLVGILTKNRSQATGGGPQTTAASRLRASLKKATTTALECSELVKKGIEYSTKENDGFPTLSDDSLRMMVRMCTKEEYFSGQNIILQGDIDSQYYVLRRGRVEVLVDDARVATLEWGMAFGEIGLLLNTKRTATVSAITPCEVYVLDRAGYETVLSLLPEDQRVGPLAKALNNFWALMTGPDGSQRQSVDFKTYLKAHVRTSKTLTSNSDLDEFDEDEEREVAQSDWSEDCERYGMKVTESLNREQYFDAMYQLVDLWSEDCNLSFATFLNWVFENIAMWHEGKDCWVFRDMNAVECVGDKFEELKEEARAEEEAKEQREADAMAAAEEARRLHAEQVKEEARLAAIEAAEIKKKQEEQERHIRETDKLGAERLDINAKLSALDDEEAELQRRLASGELSPEEEAEVRARLAAIASERDALKLQYQENEHNAQLAGYDKALRGLDNEEAELRRRLEAGELSAEEEAAIRKRLGEIASERESLLTQKHDAISGQAANRAEHAEAQRAAQVAALNRKLRELDDEETDLLRRLASGELTPEEEAEVRARLAAIQAERVGLEAQRDHVIADGHAADQERERERLNAENGELDRQLSALDDEEAELQRRLASGELSPEEEAEVRARLAAIASERAAINYEQSQNAFAARHAEINAQLSALDDEEAELRRRLEAGELSAEEEAAIRKRLEEIEGERNALRRKQMEIYREEEEAMEQLASSGVLSAHEMKRVQNRIQALLAFQQGAVDGGPLGDEEEELMRRLASGELSSEEAAAARAKLAELAAERKAAARDAKRKQARDDERQELARKVDAINAQLSALDDEEAELRRRLEAGELSAEEEAAIRKRLGEIDKARAGLTAERDATMALQEAMDATERAALEAEEQAIEAQAEERRLGQLEHERKREAARRKRKARRRQNLFATINLDPKQGFHENEEDDAPALRFHGVGQPRVQSVLQASEHLEPLRHSLGETLQPAAMVGTLGAAAAAGTSTSFGFGFGTTTDMLAAMTARDGHVDANDTISTNWNETARTRTGLPVPLGGDEDDTVVSPVLVRSRTLEAQDKAKAKRNPYGYAAETRALVEALDEVAVVRVPITRTIPSTAQLLQQPAQHQHIGGLPDLRRTDSAASKFQRLVGGGSGGGGRVSASPTMGMSADTTTAAMYGGGGNGGGRRAVARGVRASWPGASGPGSGSGLSSSSSLTSSSVDIGRNGLPVSLARALAMQATYDYDGGGPKGGGGGMQQQHHHHELGYDYEAARRQRLQTALRGKRLPAGFTHRPQSYTFDRIPAVASMDRTGQFAAGTAMGGATAEQRQRQQHGSSSKGGVERDRPAAAAAGGAGVAAQTAAAAADGNGAQHAAVDVDDDGDDGDDGLLPGLHYSGSRVPSPNMWSTTGSIGWQAIQR